MTDQPTVFKTNDMAMTTFLRLQGHLVTDVFWESRTCYWTFAVTDELQRDVDSFVSDDARVSPKQYNRAFNITKSEFYSNDHNARKG